MENLSITRIITNNLELVESISVTLFNNTVDIYIKNIHFNIKIIEDNNTKYASIFEKVNTETFNIILYNFQDNQLLGMPIPEEFGLLNNIRYYISVIGMSFVNPEYKSITINIFKDSRNV
jgi:uncharacterized integral membrane protein